MSNESRPYRKRLRAEQEAETRRRIARSAMELHGSVGPARTSISAVAEHAGVRRATVYRHYPDDAALFAACSSLWAELNPFPDLGALAGIRDPHARREAGFAAVYGFYRANAAMLANVLRDAPLVPALQAPVAGLRAVLAGAAAALAPDLPEAPGARRRMQAALELALSFPGWQALTGGEAALDDAEAATLAVDMVRAAKDGAG